MYWPRLRLTKEESKRWAPYSQPNKLQRNVLYRVYAGELIMSMTNKEDSENFQISRRARIFAITASGDIANTEVQIFDSTGEQYTMGFIPMSNLLCGTAADYRAMGIFSPVASGVNNNAVGFSTPYVFGVDTVAPHVFEPNIGLDPNQTLTIKSQNMKVLTQLPSPPAPANTNEISVVSLCFHVWEFPIE
jgi:hypothetical protein